MNHDYFLKGQGRIWLSKWTPQWFVSVPVNNLTAMATLSNASLPIKRLQHVYRPTSNMRPSMTLQPEYEYEYVGSDWV